MWVWQRKGFCKEDFLCTFYSSKITLSKKESEQNDQDELGESKSEKTKGTKKGGKAKKGRKMVSKELTSNAGTTVVKTKCSTTKNIRYKISLLHVAHRGQVGRIRVNGEKVLPLP